MNLQEIRTQLPHGGISEIAKRTNMSTSTVSLFFKGKLNVSNSAKIISTAADIIVERKKSEREAIDYIRKAIKQ